MAIYLINLVLILFEAFFLKILKIPKATCKKIFIIVTFLQLYLLLALRDSYVGTDLNTYLSFFERSKLESFWNFDFARYEIGYVLLNKLLSFINNEQIFIGVISFIPIFVIFRFIYRESKIIWLSIFLFITLGFFTNSFNIIRQMFAMSIITISYKYLVNNNFKRFIVTVLIASCFHNTALIFIPIYLFKNFNLNIKNYLMHVLMSVILYFEGDKIINFALSNFSSVSYEIKSNGGMFMLIFLILIYVFTLIHKKEALNQNPNLVILYNICLSSIFMQILALKFSLFIRVGLYFSMFFIILIPEVISNIKNKNMYMMSILTITVLTTTLYIVNLLKDTSGIIPYNVFF